MSQSSTLELPISQSPLGKATLRILDPTLDADRYDNLYEEFSGVVLGQQGQAVTPAWAKEILLTMGLFDEEAIDQLMPDVMEDGMVRLFRLRFLNPAIPWKEVVDLNHGPLHDAMAFTLWHNAMAPSWMMEDTAEFVGQTFDNESEFMVRGLRESPVLAEGATLLLEEVTSLLRNYPDLDDVLNDILALHGDSKLSGHLRAYRKAAESFETYNQAEERLRQAGHDDMADHIHHVRGSDVNTMVESARQVLWGVLTELRNHEDDLPALAACISLAQSVRARFGLPPYRSMYERLL